jgi:hypothetical protein
MTKSDIIWDIHKFEEALAREVRNRNFPVHPLPPDSDSAASHFFEQFLIVGLPPASPPNAPAQILVAYPPTEIHGLSFDRVIAMCLPSGISRRHLLSRSSSAIQDHFVFMLGQGLSPVYGVCLHIGGGMSTFFDPAALPNVTFAFCFLTRQPVFSAHFQFLAYLLFASLGQFEPLIFDPQNRRPPRILSGRPITTMRIDEDGFAHNSDIVVPHFFTNALKFYEDCGPYHPPLRLGRDIEIYFPASIETNFPLYYTLDTLFSLLSIDDIVRIVGAIFLDATVLVLGSSLKEVTHCVLALQFLIHPCLYCGPVIPILPSNPEFLALLDSPTPFISGVVPSTELRSLSFLDTSIFVNLDRRAISSSEFPSYPHHREISRKIEAILAKEKSQTPHPFGYPLIFRRHMNHRFSFSPTTANLIAATIREPLWQILTDFVHCFFVSDMTSAPDGRWVTVFNSELYLAQVEAEWVEFFTALVESQNFGLYIEAKITSYLAHKGAEGKAAMLGNLTASGNRGLVRRRTKSIDHELLEVV